MYFAEFETSSHIHEKFDTLTRFLLPFFFIYVGLGLHFDVMGISTLTIAVALIAVAIITKYLGGFAGCKICRMNNTDSNFVASCIIARGDIAIIVATLAHTMGLFDTDMYAAVIIMAVATQIIAPVVINKMYRKTKLCADTEKKEEAEAVSE
jgi:Kef-type K+ transport system membrane component KefB